MPSTSSSSADEGTSAKTPKVQSKSSSDSDFEDRVLPSTTTIKASPKPNLLSTIPREVANDFTSKMNAATRNFPLNTPVPWKKMKKIGFDNDQTLSVGIRKDISKNSSQIASPKNSSSETSDSGPDDAEPFRQVNPSPVKNASQSVALSKSPMIENKVKTSPNKSIAICKKYLSSSDSDDESDVENRGVTKAKASSEKKHQQSSSDSDSADDNKEERIKKVKKETKPLDSIKNSRKSSSDSSNTSTDEKVVSMKKETQSSDNTDRDSSDDEKMTSILTQRNTTKSSDSSSSDSDRGTPKRKMSLTSRKSESDVEDDSSINQHKLFSNFLKNNPEYREIQIKSSFGSECISKGDEVYFCSVPKHIPPDLLLNKEFSLDNLTTISFGPDKYNIKSQKFGTNKRSLCLVNRHKNTTVLSLDLAGLIKVSMTSDNIQMDKQINLKEVTTDKVVAVPKLKQRHPLFGSDLSKVILSEAVQTRLDSMIEDLNKRVIKSKSKQTKLSNESEASGIINKEDIYKIVNFLQEASGGIDTTSKIETTKKSKKKSAKNIEPDISTVVKDIKSEYDLPTERPSKKTKMTEPDHPAPNKIKKSKLKLNLPPQDVPKLTPEHLELVSDTKPENGNTKPKKNKNLMLANSTFASPSINTHIKFETNESIIPIDESSKSTKHMKKTIKKETNLMPQISVVESSKKASKKKVVEEADSWEADVPQIVDESQHLKHLEKLIKKAAKRKNTESNMSNTEIDSANIEDAASLPKKKKKKKKKKGESFLKEPLE